MKTLTAIGIGLALTGGFMGGMRHGYSTERAYETTGMYRGNKGNEVKIDSTYYKRASDTDTLVVDQDKVQATIEVPKWESIFEKRATNIRKIE